MSRADVDWAIAQSPPKSADRHVLLYLAHAANAKTGDAFPSIAAIAERTALNRKTIIESLARLQRLGLIIDTGRRIGRTAQIKVWHVGAKGSVTGTLSDG